MAQAPRSRRSEPTPQPPAPNTQNLTPLLAGWLEDGLTPGLAVVIGKDGRLVAEFYGGLADDEHAVGADTLFCLGSLTTLFTACTAMALVEDGKLALSEPLGEL